MTTPTFTLPTSGSDPKRATKEDLEENINQIIQYLDNARIAGDDAGTEGFYNAGPWDASTGTFPVVRGQGGSVQNGDVFVVSTAGVVDGQPEFQVEQRIVAQVDNPSSSTYAGNWLRSNTIAILAPLTARVAAAETITQPIIDGDRDFTSGGYSMKHGASVIRQTSDSSGWEFVVNATHQPVNFDNVAVVGNAIRLTYSFDAEKVGSFSVTPDETFASYGVVTGASVGTTIAEVSAYATITGVIKAGTNGIQENSSTGTLTSQVVDQAAGTITVTHSAQSHTATEGSAVIVSRRDGTQYGEFVVSMQTKTGFTLQYMRPCALYVEYDGTDWIFTGATAAGFSGVWSSNYLQITTPTNGVTDPVYTVGRTLETSRRDHPVTKNTGSSSLRVYFLDKDNNIEAAPQTGMKFTLNSSMLFPASIPDGFGVLGAVERQNVPCDVNKLSATNGNFWLTMNHLT